MISVNLEKARAILHAERRRQRDMKFEPLDRKATVPALADEAEAERQKIRDADADFQNRINACSTVEELQVCVTELKENN